MALSISPYELDNIYCGDSALMLAALPDGCLSKQLRLQPSNRPGIRSIIYMLAPLCRVTRETQWLNVINIASTTLANRKDVIGCEFDARSVAPKALVAIVIAQRPELCGGVRATGFCLVGAATVGKSVGPIRIGLAPTAASCRRLIRVCLTVAASVFCYFVWVISCPSASSLRIYVGVGLPIAAAGLCLFVRVILYPLTIALALALSASPALIPLTCAALLTWFTVPCCHNEKISLPDSPIKRLRLQFLSGRLPRPHVLKPLARLSGLLFLVA